MVTTDIESGGEFLEGRRVEGCVEYRVDKDLMREGRITALLRHGRDDRGQRDGSENFLMGRQIDGKID